MASIAVIGNGLYCRVGKPRNGVYEYSLRVRVGAAQTGSRGLTIRDVSQMTGAGVDALKAMQLSHDGPEYVQLPGGRVRYSGSREGMERSAIRGTQAADGLVPGGAMSPQTKSRSSRPSSELGELALVLLWQDVLRDLSLEENKAGMMARKILRAERDSQGDSVRPLVEALGLALASGIDRIKGVPRHGVRVGNWLSLQQAQALLDTPARSTFVGKRDRALLAVLLGAGLRREETCNLTFEHIEQRDGRWCVVDITGKGGRIRTVPIADFVKLAIDEWASVAGISTGIVFRVAYSRRFDYHAARSMRADGQTWAKIASGGLHGPRRRGGRKKGNE